MPAPMDGGLAPPFAPPVATLVLGKHSGKRVLNPLEKKQYAKLGRNNAVEARPAVLHFGGFELGRRHTQVVRVVNTTAVAQRVHVLNPATPFFSAQVPYPCSLATTTGAIIIHSLV